MDKPDFLKIPTGIGASKRLFLALGGLLLLIIILFLTFLNAYTPKHHQATAHHTPKAVADNEEVNAMIAEAENEKHHPQLLPAKDIQTISTKPVEPTSKLSGDQFKEAGQSSLSVYQKQSSRLTNSFHSLTSSSASSISDGNLLPHQKSEYATQNNQSHKVAFLKQSTTKDRINAHLQKPLSKYEINAGTIIPATMMTGINSDLPGNIIAKVSRDVFDTATGNYLLIPQGTTIIGDYDSQISYGQSRVLIAWKRLIFPNGSSFDLAGMPGADLTGMAGLHDQVDHHYTRIFGSALLMSVFGAASQLTQSKSNGDHQTPQEMIYAAIGQQISQTGAQMIAKNMNIQPTIKIRPSASFNVLLTRDMVLPSFYRFS